MPQLSQVFCDHTIACALFAVYACFPYSLLDDGWLLQARDLLWLVNPGNRHRHLDFLMYPQKAYSRRVRKYSFMTEDSGTEFSVGKVELLHIEKSPGKQHLVPMTT